MLIVLACSDHPMTIIKDVAIDLNQLKKKGVLTMLTENSSTSYYIYREKEMGFEYEILSDFAKHIGLKLQVKVISDARKFHSTLQSGEGDIIACNYTITRDRQFLILKHDKF